MQLTTPIDPAMAVSTAINTLSSLLQSTFLDIYFSCFRLHIISFFLIAVFVSHRLHKIHRTRIVNSRGHPEEKHSACRMYTSRRREGEATRKVCVVCAFCGRLNHPGGCFRIGRQVALLGEDKPSFVATDANAPRRRLRFRYSEVWLTPKLHSRYA
jgi:hypothetical protein